MRKIVDETTTLSNPVEELNRIVPGFGKLKEEYDSIGKVVESDKSRIKSLLLEANQDKFTAGGYTVSRSVSFRESLNEDKLLAVVKKYNIPVVKTKEYVDMAALEDWMYKSDVTDDMAVDLASCKSSVEVVQLRVGKEKKKKEED